VLSDAFRSLTLLIHWAFSARAILWAGVYTHGMSLPGSRHLKLLSAVANLPTAPFLEQHVIAWITAWAGARNLPARRDKAGNLYLDYRRGSSAPRPLILEAHLDHPGFVVTRRRRDGILETHFRGGVRPSHFKNARAQFWLPGEKQWAAARVLSA